jgi:hypothetical protein
MYSLHETEQATWNLFLSQYGRGCEAMNEAFDHPEQPRHFLSRDVWEWDSYQALQDQYHILLEQRETLLGYHRAMMEHHQTVIALYEEAMDSLQSGQGKEQTWSDYHTALRDHQQMIVDQRQLIRNYLRMSEKRFRKRELQ